MNQAKSCLQHNNHHLCAWNKLIVILKWWLISDKLVCGFNHVNCNRQFGIQSTISLENLISSKDIMSYKNKMGHYCKYWWTIVNNWWIIGKIVDSSDWAAVWSDSMVSYNVVYMWVCVCVCAVYWCQKINLEKNTVSL